MKKKYRNELRERNCTIFYRRIENSVRTYQIRGFSIEHDEFLLKCNNIEPDQSRESVMLKYFFFSFSHFLVYLPS